MKRFFELTYPYIFAAIAFLIWMQLNGAFPAGTDIITAVLTLAGIFVGFLATSKAILISTENQVMKDLRESNYMDDLVTYIRDAIWSSLALCALSVISFFIDTSERWFGLLWIPLAVFSFSAFFRVADVMIKLFKFSQKTD